MPTTALYNWRVAGSPVEILIDLSLVDRLRIAGAAASAETGGILLGYYDGNYSVINDFEIVESEHRRGDAYTLSQRDESRLASRLESKRKRGSAVPVGFFRTHLRPGMFLDEGDNHVLSAFFSNANQVALLIKPSPERGATGGFFFWEEGEMNRKQSYLPFPMSSRELEGGDFPLVEPVAPDATPLAAASFGDAETVELTHLNGKPGPEDCFSGPAGNFSGPAGSFSGKETQVRDTTIAMLPPSRSRNLPWQLIGLVAAIAAFGGYLIGTSGSRRDRFGARSGDMTLNSSPPDPVPDAPAKTAPVDRSGRPAAMPAVQTAETRVPADAANPAISANAPDTASNAGAAKPIPLAVVTTQVVRDRPKLVPSTPLEAKSREPKVTPAGSLAPPVAEKDAGWQHFHTEGAVAPAQVAEAAPLPATPAIPRATPPIAVQPVGLSSVYLEAVESGSVGKAIGKIPLFGALHRSRSGDNYTPPQALHSAAPKVPAQLARELTGTLPVDLRLKVDTSGRVSSVEIISHQSPAEFVRLAGDAAYDWRFEPARVKDKVVSSDVIAHFKFRPAL